MVKLEMIILTLIILLSCAVSTGHYGLNEREYKFVKIESKDNGALDFRSKQTDNPTEVYIIEDAGVWIKKSELPVLLWAAYVTRLGITNQDSVIAFYKEVYGDSLSKSAKRAIILGCSEHFKE